MHERLTSGFTLLEYAADCHRILEVEYPQKEECYLHKNLNNQMFKSNLSITNSFENLLTDLRKEYCSDFYINWDEIFIYSMNCESCGKKILIKKFKSEISDKSRWCADCASKYNASQFSGTGSWQTIKELRLTNTNHQFFLELPMSDFGIKENDIILVKSRNGNFFVLL